MVDYGTLDRPCIVHGNFDVEVVRCDVKLFYRLKTQIEKFVFSKCYTTGG
jgi:hypothetical protein